jgi:hypothetical protein
LSVVVRFDVFSCVVGAVSGNIRDLEMCGVKKKTQSEAAKEKEEGTQHLEIIILYFVGHFLPCYRWSRRAGAVALKFCLGGLLTVAAVYRNTGTGHPLSYDQTLNMLSRLDS